MLKIIRRDLGLSQELVAGYLEVSRSHLAMIESNRRDLNSKAYDELMALHDRLFSKDSKKSRALAPDIEKAIAKKLEKLIDRHLRQLEYMLSRVKKNLNKSEEKTEKAAALLAKIESLKSGATVKDKYLIAIIESSAIQVYKGDSFGSQLKLQMKIEGIKAQLKFLQHRKESLNI